MKIKFTPLTLFSLALLFGLSTSCSTSNVVMQVLAPAQISVSSDIQELALVNRYRPGKGEGLLNVLEGALTGENIGQDRRSAEAALGGLTNALAGSPRFRITRPGVELKGTGRGDFPAPLEVNIVRDICARNRADALVTIEAFDSDTQESCKAEVREKKVKGETIKYTVFMAEKNIDVTVGWRMYDGQSGVLIDEYRMGESVYFDAEGDSEAEAYGNLPGQNQVTTRIGEVTGNKYSERISPTWLTVNRRYYSKGSDALKIAKRQVRYKDWEKAEAWWDKALDDPKEKVRGRAMYNKALAAEMRGDLSLALDLATEAGQKYGDKRAYSYTATLRRRIAEQQILNEQMQGAPE
ncbi:MAG TPA: hypothetical protein ENJ82_14185 [Bacteroidetes bacterium]|nr:hypothetical protein [Bacteroidota bacterium]